MKIQSIDSKQKLANIVSSVGRSPLSWQGWKCLKIEITGKDSFDYYTECILTVQSLLEAYLRNVEGSVYFCQNQHIHVFCKDVRDSVLRETGQQIKNLLAVDDLPLNIDFDIFDLEKDSYAYVNDTLEQEGGMYTIPISTYSDLDSYIGHSVLTRADNFTEKTIKSYQDYTKVLLIEDDPITRWMVRKCLKTECIFSSSPTANQAFQNFSSFQPDVVFLDINLPDQNGRHVLQWIKRQDPGVSVIMFSSSNNLENITDTLEEGAAGFIAKPFVKEELMHYINAHSR